MGSPVNVSTWLKTKAAARRLGVTPRRLEQLAATGKLVIATDFLGVRRYDPEPLERLRARDKAGHAQALRSRVESSGQGAKQALAFKLFAAGRAARDIVIETELAPSTVLDLKAQFAAMGGDLLLPGPVLEELRDVLDWRDEASPSELVRAVRARLRKSFRDGQSAATDLKTTEKTSGEHHSRAQGEGGRPAHEVEGVLRRDQGGETPH